MHRIRLKIVGFAVLAFIAAALSIKALWPTKPQAQPAAQEKTNKRAERLYRMAKLQKEKADSSNSREYFTVIAFCRNIIERYPDTPQARKAKR
ncbi:MAG: hypothetical protein ACYS76_12390 [Planctomycetota bacterium]|jgi:hypothetical protein